MFNFDSDTKTQCQLKLDFQEPQNNLSKEKNIEHTNVYYLESNIRTHKVNNKVDEVLTRLLNEAKRISW